MLKWFFRILFIFSLSVVLYTYFIDRDFSVIQVLKNSEPEFLKKIRHKLDIIERGAENRKDNIEGLRRVK